MIFLWLAQCPKLVVLHPVYMLANAQPKDDSICAHGNTAHNRARCRTVLGSTISSFSKTLSSATVVSPNSAFRELSVDSHRTLAQAPKNSRIDEFEKLSLLVER